MSLFDLLAVGIGGTVGSGVFVLSGMIAKQYTGPGVVFSFLIAGVSCLFSACSYGELSSRIPSAGSSYAYVYVALGEYLAVIAAWCLSLEYGISGAAVARSWGDKLSNWITNFSHAQQLTHMPAGINLFAGLLQLATVFILLAGVDVGKITVNIFTSFKVLLIIFMIIAGFSAYKAENVKTWAPMGVSGVMRGATSCFFGFVGYDEVCCMAAEAKDPHRTLPAAVFGTIVSVTVMYCLASWALVGMQHYRDIDSDSGFSEAFRSCGMTGAANFVAIGELVSLPLVVLVSFLAQPRLQYAMAEDGLLPKAFCEVDRRGNLTKGIIISGVACTLVAIFVPFTYLDDMISAGVLFSFNLTNTSLLILRRCDPVSPSRCRSLVGAFHVLCVALAIATNAFGGAGSPGSALSSTALIVALAMISLGLVGVTWLVHSDCPENPDPHRGAQYRVPWVPFFPLLGILINYLLLAQLSATGLMLIIGYFGLATVFYVSYGVRGPEVAWKVEALRGAAEMSMGSGSGSDRELLAATRITGGTLELREAGLGKVLEGERVVGRAGATADSHFGFGDQRGGGGGGGGGAALRLCAEELSGSDGESQGSDEEVWMEKSEEVWERGDGEPHPRRGRSRGKRDTPLSHTSRAGPGAAGTKQGSKSRRRGASDTRGAYNALHGVAVDDVPSQSRLRPPPPPIIANKAPRGSETGDKSTGSRSSYQLSDSLSRMWEDDSKGEKEIGGSGPTFAPLHTGVGVGVGVSGVVLIGDADSALVPPPSVTNPVRKLS